MKKYSYLLSSLLLLLLAVVISSCGGGGDNGILPNTNSQQPQLIQKDVSGYIFHLPDQGVNDFLIIDAPITGENSFISQMKAYLEQNYPDTWNTPELQGIYNQLSSEVANWQPLPQYNSSAQLFCSYSDIPIPVAEDGYFQGTVSVPAGSENVSFDVIIGEELFGTDTIASSDFLSSSNTGTGILKCSNKSIIALPGGLSIFKVFSTPAAPVKEGLTFELEDTSIGTITPPFFLKINGEVNYNLAYGIFKAADIMSKASKTNVSNGKGNNLYIPTDIVHETVSVSGKVFTGGEPLIKGHVTSIGPKSSAFLDAEGNYVLPEVFKGSQRKVVATWWTGSQQGNNKTKHTEIRYIEYLDSDLTGFNFGVVIQPTPTPLATPTPRDPWAPIYDIHVSKVIYQYNQWEDEFGAIEATQKTIQWLNGDIPELSIPGFIIGARTYEFDDTAIWIDFEDGHTILLGGEVDRDNWYINKPPYPQPQSPRTSNNMLTNSLFVSDVTTVPSYEILILAPYVWEEELASDPDAWPPQYDDWPKPSGIETRRVYSYIAYDLDTYKYPNSDEKIYKVHRKVTKYADILFADLYSDPNAIDLDPDVAIYFPDYDPNAPENQMVQRCLINTSNENSIVTPEDFTCNGEYGVVYIATHGNKDQLSCGLFYDNVENMGNWIKTHQKLNKDHPEGLWFLRYQAKRDPNDPEHFYHVKRLNLTYNFFLQQDFSNAIVYIDSCWSESLQTNYQAFKGAKVFLGHDESNFIAWSREIAFYLFSYLIYGTKTPSSQTPLPKPMSVAEAYNKLSSELNVNPDPKNYGPRNPNEPYNPEMGINVWDWQGCQLEMITSDPNTYFPAPATLVINNE